VTGITGTITAIAAGGATSYALMNDGTVWAWGYNGFGQLGVDPTATPFRATPQQVMNGATPLSGVAAIAAGLTHAVALMNDGTVMSWGGNIYGQMGINKLADQLARTNLFFSTPQQVQASPGVPLAGVAALVVVSGNHTVVRMTDGSLRAWGSNLYGQLGDGTTDISPLPKLVAGFP
jgi:alpha-tubulin suppressor-like RCC1 family protein